MIVTLIFSFINTQTIFFLLRKFKNYFLCWNPLNRFPFFNVFLNFSSYLINNRKEDVAKDLKSIRSFQRTSLDWRHRLKVNLNITSKVLREQGNTRTMYTLSHQFMLPLELVYWSRENYPMYTRTFLHTFSLK